MPKENPKNTRQTRNKPASGRASKTAKTKVEVSENNAIPVSENSHNKESYEPKSASDIDNQETSAPHKTQQHIAMEVHHHPRLDHKPKPWKEYFLEGFMIFIAVMMGFIAENIREDITNREHVRQLTSQLVQELKTDTANLDEIYSKELQIRNSNDSLFELLNQPMAKVDMKSLQKLASDSHSLWPFHPSTGAIAAIKNELHLKQFSDSKIISYIADYEGSVELLHTIQDITLQYQRSFLDSFLRLHFTPDNLKAAFDKTTLSSEMRNLKQEDLTQLRADMVLIRINTNELVNDNRKLKNATINLLRYVIEQYHLESE
jgi:hypothetical protein